MKMILVAILACVLGPLAPPQANDATGTESIRFTSVRVFIDSGATPLAAYQIEVWAAGGDVKIVGIEGGARDGAFAEPPFYDPAAMQHDRVIIADFSTLAADRLPSGRVRVATIHVQVTGEAKPEYKTELSAVATAGGAVIPARIELETGPST